ncbi:1397_t:CDS:1 [Ambispora gerdemannii]|uniref:1397_t:CDS:1 n=1 Tax=Ambispora gerdemannii TaxID=144530 RepID=A0A9N9BJH3_9GLOM|nr:1397_t:CDS:1 [Ambispora gerdemannii]
MTEIRKYENSKFYYFEDGNILLKAENTIFKVHRGILSCASVVFNDMFEKADGGNTSIPEVSLTESASELELLLNFVYPSPKVRLNWQTIPKLLQLADKYIIKSILDYGKDFLGLHFRENLIISLVVAETHSFSQIYKESFILVVDQLPEYIKMPEFINLSKETIIKLQACWFKYIERLGKLNNLNSCTFIPRRQHTCGERSTHNNKVFDELEKRIKKIQVFPPPPPSEALEDLLDKMKLGYNDDWKIEEYLSRNVEMCLGKFDRLDSESNKRFDKNYLSFDN